METAYTIILVCGRVLNLSTKEEFVEKMEKKILQKKKNKHYDSKQIQMKQGLLLKENYWKDRKRTLKNDRNETSRINKLK